LFVPLLSVLFLVRIGGTLLVSVTRVSLQTLAHTIASGV
jgi:hypothetical protein